MSPRASGRAGTAADATNAAGATAVRATAVRAAAVGAAVVGLAAGLALGLARPDTDLVARWRAWTTPVVVGLVVAAALALLARQHRRRRAREQAVRAEAEAAARADRARLLGRLDHELKNPLTAAHAALANAPDDPHVASAQQQVDRLWSLLADLRKLVEVESAPLEVEAVDLGELLDEVRDAATDLPGGDQRRFRTSVPEAPRRLPPVPADRDLLYLALVNVAANAVKFSHPGATVELRVRDEGGAALVEVADTGIGVPAAEVDRVWEELSRGTQAHARPGSGIGLALVRTVVRRHGGTVELTSREGEGTVVRLWLPLGPVPPPSAPWPAADVAGLRHDGDHRHTLQP